MCKRNINIDLYQKAIAFMQKIHGICIHTPEYGWFSDNHQGKEKEGKPEETLD